MRPIKSLMLLAGSILLLNSCTDTARSTELSYYETQCSNPWINYVDDNQHMNNVLQYLSANGVNATDIELTVVQDSAMACAACICPSGVRVNITVPDVDVAEANALGFN